MSLKSELKNGAVIELRNGEKAFKIDNTLIFKDGGFTRLTNYNDDLLNSFVTDYDIVKIDNEVKNTSNACSVAYYNHFVHEKNCWTWERSKEILDDVEKEYLSAVIKPFRNKILSIRKGKIRNQEFIIIRMINSEHNIIFPPFVKDKMYKGMVTDRPYTIKELGL